MSIAWRKVTWYSKVLSFAFFIGLVFGMHRFVVWHDGIRWSVERADQQIRYQKALLAEQEFREARRSIGPEIVYESKNLGIRFRYAEWQMAGVHMVSYRVHEEQNRISILENNTPQHGQELRVFSKPERESLRDAIRKQFLGAYPHCGVFEERPAVFFDSDEYPREYIRAYVWPERNGTPDTALDVLTLDGQRYLYSVCPPGFVLGNSGGGFLMDEAHPATFLFLALGNGIVIPANEQQGWHETITFL